MNPRWLLLQTWYPEFLDELYAAHPGLASQPYASQRRTLLNTRFGVSDAYSHGLGKLGCAAEDIIVNADPLQAAWAREHGLNPVGNIHDRRRQIVAAQIKAAKPDVLYVFEWCPLGDAFLADIKSSVPYMIGQIGSSPRTDRTYAAYNLLISSWPPLVDTLRRQGRDAAHLALGFDERVLEALSPAEPCHEVTFVGGLAAVHDDRIPWLEALARETPLTVYGYGLERTTIDSPLRGHHHGPAWGLSMYDVLARSRITLNRHGVIALSANGGERPRRLVNNMRLFEATGVGTCLLTDTGDNLDQYFVPGQEVATYADDRECIERIRHLLEHPHERAAIAAAGQRRTHRDHTYTRRMTELLDILRPRL